MPVENVLSSTFDHPRLPLDVQRAYRELGYWEGTTLARCVEDWANRDPDRIAVVGDRVLTYGEVWEEARRLGGSLQEQGLKPGEYLLAVLHNSWQGLVLEVAASQIGAVFAPRSPHISPALALNLFDQLDARGLVLDADLLKRDGWQEAFDSMSSRLDSRPVKLQDDSDSCAAVPCVSVLESVVTSGPLAEAVDVNPTAPSLVLATGGTTGTPKSILHCSDGVIYAARHFAKSVGYTKNDVTVAFAPYGHAGGSIFDIYMPLIHGARVLPLSRWHADEVSPLIQKWGGTFFVTMGTHIYDLLELPESNDANLASMRLATSGAGPDDLFVRAQERFDFTLVRAYGCGESPGHALGRSEDPESLRLLKDGVPFEGVEVRITDGIDGAEVENGVIGDYECRGPNLFMSYVGQPDLTDEAISEDGFYRSGDRIRRSDDGYLTWSGRSKEIIRRGGLQIDPVEMESMLARDPRVSAVVVVGEPDDRLGERAVIVATPVPGADLTLEDLCAVLIDAGLPKQSLPERLVLTSDIPRTELGKYHRAHIRSSLNSLSMKDEVSHV